MRARLFLSAIVVVALSSIASDASADEPAAADVAAPRPLVFMMELLLGRSLRALTTAREVAERRGLPELRQPQWWGPDPPKAPTLHVRLLRITF